MSNSNIFSGFQNIVLTLFLSVSYNSFAQIKNENIPPQPPAQEVIKKNPQFGNYYKIGKYPIRVPFNEQPNVSPVGENQIFKLTSYQYAYPSPKDDVNILYGVDVCEYKNDSLYNSPKKKIDYMLAMQKTMYGNQFKGVIIREVNGGKDEGYYVRQKMKIESKDIGEIYLTSLYFYSRNVVVRLFVFSKDNVDNQRTEDYFASIEFEDKK